MTDRKIRVQLDLAPKAYDRLIDLKDETEATSMTDVVKAALKVYERVIAIQTDGGRLKMVDASGQETELLVVI